MANKAADLVGPFRAGSQVYDPILPEPSVPVGYTRYLTNITTANMGEGSIFQGKTIENEMPVHLPDTVTPTGSGGYIDGFLIVDPSTITYYIYTPSTGEYDAYVDALLPPAVPSGTASGRFTVKSGIVTSIVSKIASNIVSKITYN
jgi:hypothetical protein